jgi:hypothetical protein
MAMSSYTPANSVLNPLVGSAPASIPTNNAIQLFAKWVEEYERKEFPVTSMITQRKEPFDQLSIKVGQSYDPFIETAIKVQTTNNSANVDVDDTSYIREGDVVEIIDYYADGVTLDFTTREVAVVNSVTDTDTLVLYRDSDKTSSGSWPVHPVDSYVRVIGSAVAYNQPFREAPTFRGDFIANYPQRFDTKLVGDIAGIATADYESKNHFEREIKNKTRGLKWEREQMIISGWKMTGDATTGDGNAKPHEMGGMLWWINQGNSDNIVDLGNTSLDMYDLRDIRRTVWKNNKRGPAGTALMGPDTYEIVSMMLNPFKGQAGLNDTTISLDVDRIKNKFWGDVDPKPIHGFPEGTIAFIDPKDWEYGHYKNCDWQVVRRGPEETDRPTNEWIMWGDWSLICTDLQRQHMITGIDTRLNSYTGRNIFLT